MTTLAPPEVLTVAEAAAILRITEKSVLELVQLGRLPAFKIQRVYRIPAPGLAEFMGRSPVR